MPPDSTFQGGGVILNILGPNGGLGPAPPPPPQKKKKITNEEGVIMYILQEL